MILYLIEDEEPDREAEWDDEEHIAQDTDGKQDELDDGLEVDGHFAGTSRPAPSLNAGVHNGQPAQYAQSNGQRAVKLLYIHTVWNLECDLMRKGKRRMCDINGNEENQLTGPGVFKPGKSDKTQHD